MKHSSFSFDKTSVWIEENLNQIMKIWNKELSHYSVYNQMMIDFQISFLIGCNRMYNQGDRNDFSELYQFSFSCANLANPSNWNHDFRIEFFFFFWSKNHRSSQLNVIKPTVKFLFHHPSLVFIIKRKKKNHESIVNNQLIGRDSKLMAANGSMLK